MWFNRRSIGQSSTAFRLMLKVVNVCLIATLCALFTPGIHAAFGHADVTTRTATEVPDVPVSQPLILLWQADIVPDDLVVDANFITVDDQGNCYVGSGAGYPVKKFDTNGKMVATFGGQGTGDGQFTFETGIAVDSLSNVYVGDFVKNPRIEKFDSKGNFVTSWATEAPTGPSGIAVDSKGNVYVANLRTHDYYLQKYDSTGRLLIKWGTTGTGDGQIMAGPRSGIGNIATDKQDNLYVTDVVNNRIQKFNSDGVFLTKFGGLGLSGPGQFQGPTSVAVDGQGNIYLNDRRFLQKLDPTGKLLAQWSTAANSGDLDRADQIAVTAQGDIYTIVFASVSGATGTFDVPVLKKFRQS